MKELLSLLKLTIIGCRDAAATHRTFNATHELGFSISVLKAMRAEKTNTERMLSVALRELETASMKDATGSLRVRCGVYASLVNRTMDGTCECCDGNMSPVFQMILGTIESGHQRALQSLSNGDLRRCEIEMEHVHNLPWAPVHEGTMRHYLSTERDYFLDRLEAEYGKSERRQAEITFRKFWRVCECWLTS